MSKELSDTYQKIYSIVRQIPYGKVTTYGLIAKVIGESFSARVVGYALNHAHQFEDIPAHRVVNRNGLLSGRHHFNPPTLMQQLLENEGIEVVDHQIKSFKNHLWIPIISEIM